ncbi:hypothetical protein [Streptomyces sp. MP131-18]|uniref:hypothetical protein n=1 Tax=Streptomyces sp. MP131-18 TaxID=1857892 RepID=UPI00097C1DB4|nr:hypothetical protein [Streptomyces sp. MP131-18]ONK15321.1 hypothetical protein STBA_61370 [Streptomyces sp. MP131-18]
MARPRTPIPSPRRVATARGRVPAARTRARRIVPWSMEERWTHQGCAPLVERLTQALSNAERLG